MTEQRHQLDSPDAPVDWETLARYLAGESDADEAAAVRRWLDARPDRAELVAALDRALDGIVAEPTRDLDIEGALRSVHARMEQPDVRPLTPRRGFRPSMPLWRRGGALAAAAVIIVLTVPTIILKLSGGGDRRSNASALVVRTPVGQRDSTVLSDGSRVVIGPGSELRVAADYGNGRREVTLRGEGYFDVVHDETRPFVVRAGGAVIRDVGTTFVVHSDDNEGVRVVVTSGAVQLTVAGRAADSGVVLRPTDRAMLEPAGRVTIERGSATESDMAWTRGVLVFRDAPMTQVVADLRRWYGIELRLADSALASRHLNDTFSNELPAEILTRLTLAFGAKGELRGDTIVLRDARAAGTMQR